jgi:hypothetical protein
MKVDKPMPEDRMEALEDVSEFITDLFNTDLTVVILNSEVGMECVTDGFDPEENPETLEWFLAVIFGLTQGAIDQCGGGYKIFVERDGEMCNFSEVISKLEKGLKIKLN